MRSVRSPARKDAARGMVGRRPVPAIVAVRMGQVGVRKRRGIMEREWRGKKSKARAVRDARKESGPKVRAAMATVRRDQRE